MKWYEKLEKEELIEIIELLVKKERSGDENIVVKLFMILVEEDIKNRTKTSVEAKDAFLKKASENVRTDGTRNKRITYYDFSHDR